MLTPTPSVPGTTDARIGASPSLQFGPRRGVYLNAAERLAAEGPPLDAAALEQHEQFDLLYRTLCAVMYNYVPLSGHPGGSISSGRFVNALLFGAMDYDLSNPARDDADIVSYAAGHKALGLYALWALRNEIARIGAPDLLPTDEKFQLRLEDLLGFRRNPKAATPLFQQFKAKALDGHPTPGTPFVRLSTGASGVGLPASLGLAWAAADYYGEDAPRVHIVEGEGGLTPGRVAEALAMAGTASLGNVVLHIDWNQASIDSNRVCRDGSAPGDYVQWTPAELAYLHDWNVIYVPDGFNFQEIVTAQRLARSFDNGQPTAIVYRTVKGWQYGIEGRAAHGAGHPLCSSGFQAAVSALFPDVKQSLPCCEPNAQRCKGGADGACIEQCYWDALQAIRRALTERPALIGGFAERLRAASRRLNERQLHPRPNAPQIEAAYATAAHALTDVPAALKLAPGTKTTLRDELGRVLNHYNKVTHGGLAIAAADLLGSTSISKAVEGFPSGFYHRRTNPLSRQLATGGIAEDAMTAILAGIATFGRHTGAGSSYAAFSAPLGHIAARLHAIGNHARIAVEGGENRPFFIVAAHAGLKTGEDGPTHADPQALQLLQDNFPVGAMITLTAWDPQEIWYLVSAALARRPAVIAPFVTRPPETVPDRAALGLAPAALAAQGVYRLRTSKEGKHGTIVLQGTGVANAFVFQTLPLLQEAGIDPNVYVVTSTELFDAMPATDRARVFPEAHQQEAMGITDFTLATMTRWVRSDHGRAHTLHPFKQGHFLGSGSGAMVMAEAGLDGASQFAAIQAYLASR
jgi:transketolase